MRQNNTINELRLTGCFVKVPGAIKIIADELQGKQQLKSLSLDCNRPNSAEIQAIVKLLKYNNLEHLSLQDFNLRESGAINLAKGLLYKKYPPIISLDLMRNSIDNKGGIALVKLLEKNPYLTSLELSKQSERFNLTNNIDNKILLKIQELVENNKERICQLAKYLMGHFLSPILSNKNIHFKMLKFYQACDHELLFSQLGEENYEKIAKNINIFIATNFFKLSGCSGNGKSTIEQLSSQIHYKFFLI